MWDKSPLIVVEGPTASGKTQLAIELCQKLNGEIISADSMQIYKEFNICTAKPSIEQLQKIKHYLIDILSIKDEYSVVRYVNDAKNYIQYILDNKKIPFVVGGTGLYIDSLVDDIKFEQVAIPNKIREKLWDMVKNNQMDFLLNRLKEVDIESYNKIHPNNTKKIIRAIEFYDTFGYPISMQSPRSSQGNSPYEACKIILGFRNREVLYDRINKRVDQMLLDGLIDECKRIFELNIGKTAIGAIGYKELIPYLNNEVTLDEAVENIKRETRRYSKRQITWFKRHKDVKWFYVDDYDDFGKLVLDVEKYILESRAFAIWHQKIK